MKSIHYRSYVDFSVPMNTRRNLMNLELVKTVEGGVNPKQSFTIPQVASCTGLSIPFIRKELSSGNLIGKKFGRRNLILAGELTRYLNNGSKGNSSP